METDGHVDQHSSTKEAIKTISNSLLKWPFTIGVCLQNCFSMRSIKKPTIWKKSDCFWEVPFYLFGPLFGLSTLCYITAIVPRRCGAPLKSTALLCVCLCCFLVSTKMPSKMPIVKLCQIKMWIAEYNAKYKICAQECREYMVYHVRACSFLLSTEQYTRYLLNARYQVKSNCKELSRSTLWPNSWLLHSYSLHMYHYPTKSKIQRKGCYLPIHFYMGL